MPFVTTLRAMLGRPRVVGTFEHGEFFPMSGLPLLGRKHARAVVVAMIMEYEPDNSKVVAKRRG